MKYSILLVNAFIAVAFAQKAVDNTNNKYKNIPIVSLENNQEHDGSFSYSFEGGDGTRAQQTGQLKYVDQTNAGEAVQGGYSYQVRRSRCVI
jgi:hypothetical protein